MASMYGPVGGQRGSYPHAHADPSFFHGELTHALLCLLVCSCPEMAVNKMMLCSNLMLVIPFETDCMTRKHQAC